MKGSAGDLLLAEELARKSRFADAIKVMDQLLGIPSGADSQTRLDALVDAVTSSQGIYDSVASALSEGSLDPRRIRLTRDVASVPHLLESRIVWQLNEFFLRQTEEAFEVALAGNQEIIKLLQMESASRELALDEQASLMLATTSLCVVTVRFDESVQKGLEFAVRCSPTNAKSKALISSLYESSVKKSQPDYSAPAQVRAAQRVAAEMLAPFVEIVEEAAKVTQNAASVPATSDALLDQVITNLESRVGKTGWFKKGSGPTDALALAKKLRKMPLPAHRSAPASSKHGTG